MAAVLLGQHIGGLTPGVRELADGSRAAGHAVPAPDLSEGRSPPSGDAEATASLDERVLGFLTGR